MSESPDRLVTIGNVMATVAMTEGVIRRLIKEGSFPQPVSTGVNKNLWSSNDIQAWIKQKRQQQTTSNRRNNDR
ncbi:MAG: AlpA family phage regulatory protein [Magnetococcales bacterium]|nr:AlpA family phage regulatory protein [Magnetococcales bacterium]